MWDPLSTIRQHNPGWTAPSGSRGISLAFCCDGSDDVDQTWQAMSAAGYEGTAPFDAPWGQRYATVNDPDGNPVDLFAAL